MFVGLLVSALLMYLNTAGVYIRVLFLYRVLEIARGPVIPDIPSVPITVSAG